ncbi:DNA ligase [Methanoculleus sp. FWC-SCC1]|uniref:DNA ligase n=1 Tax=Methanoculleus frigidifontis TaxID=2584085 RepID=A0ABT8MAK4_9EURY|nr:DNA polymerase ligase N-terminal domain-containing protein [Methanoculleus sp. FWC-SCC1]MDN7024963.1 DNA ligase [Methanoculleus sp. FWC-SCC1]
MADEDTLKEYHEKRNFARTPEPVPGEEEAGRRPIFVIQKHDASTLHYDLRLEVEGVLKSWAVPKGPSTDPKEKHLAVPTEDHPLEYAGFEGVIPEGEYGGGTVLVWDTGTYRNITEKSGKEIPAAEAIAGGHIAVRLEGEKLRGGYALTRFRTGKSEAWLLVKINDEAANPHRNPVTTEPRSVLTGRSLEEIAAGRQA